MTVFADMSAGRGCDLRITAWRHCQMVLMAALALAGLLGGLYLSAVSVNLIEMQGCASGSCSKFVLSTEWAHWLGVPVGLLAAAAYAVILTALPFTLSQSIERRRTAWALLLGAGICVAGAAAWFIGLMYLQVQKGCGPCLTMNVIGAVLAGLLFGVAPVGRTAGSLIRPGQLGRICGAAIIALLFLAGGQLLAPVTLVEGSQASAANTKAGEHKSDAPKVTKTPPDPNTVAGKAAILAELKQTYGDQWDQPSTTCQWTNYVMSRPGVRRTESRLMYEVIQPATGSERMPGPDDTVEIKYQGRLWTGQVFQDTLTRGLPERIAVRELLPGMAQGVRMMTEASRWRFYLPSYLAYGADGLPGVVPPDSIVVFDVELVKIHSDATVAPAAAASDVREATR
jgi:FKBP-type peptidyl-prolyl cis-trans isomerase/uncharacterized membrane protein